jgi:hypothetical protein
MEVKMGYVEEQMDGTDTPELVGSRIRTNYRNKAWLEHLRRHGADNHSKEFAEYSTALDRLMAKYRELTGTDYDLQTVDVSDFIIEPGSDPELGGVEACCVDAAG